MKVEEETEDEMAGSISPGLAPFYHFALTLWDAV